MAKLKLGIIVLLHTIYVITVYGQSKRFKLEKYDLSFGENEKSANENREAIKRVHKFSIGKDFNSNEIDEESLVSLRLNQTIYSNMPPTLSTKTVKPFSTSSSTKSTRSSSFQSFFLSNGEKMSTLSSSNKNLNRYHNNNNKEDEVLYFKPFSKKYEYVETSYQTKLRPPTTSSSKLEKIRKKLGSIDKKYNIQTINKVLNDLWSVKPLNFSKLAKGRSVEDTRAVLNNMIMALHRIQLKNQPNLNSTKFFDQVREYILENYFLDLIFFIIKKYIYTNYFTCILKVILNPSEIFPDGLFEGDIVLTKEQSGQIFSKYLNNNQQPNLREKRKTIRDVIYRWPLPIYYLFDGTHGKFLH